MLQVEATRTEEEEEEEESTLYATVRVIDNDLKYTDLYVPPLSPGSILLVLLVYDIGELSWKSESRARNMCLKLNILLCRQIMACPQRRCIN